MAAQSQYFQFSQYNFAVQRVNPAMVSSTDYASAGFLYRNQGTGADVHLNSSIASAIYPFINPNNGRRWSGIGLSLMDDRSGGIFSVQEASLSYAINVFLSRFQFLSLGFKGLYQQRSVNLNGLYTGSQYILDRGFDESLFNGENFGLLKSSFATFSTGVYWQQSDRLGRKLAWWGVSFFDLNKPSDSFSGIPARLNSTVVASGGIRLHQRDNFSLMPELLFSRSAGRNFVNAGLVASYEMRRYPNQAGDHIDLITRYVPGRSGILGLQLHREKFSIGFSYDFPVAARNVANRGAFELALEVRRLVDPEGRRRASSGRKPSQARRGATVKPMRTAAKKQESVPVKPFPMQTATDTSIHVKKDSLPGKSAVEPDLVSSLRQKSDSVIAHAKAGALSHEPFVIEKLNLSFGFEFNSVALDARSMEYLDQLSMALKENVHMRIRLTGHTDNIGSRDFNLRLSRFRANVVRDYLLSKGIEPSRVEADGKGLTQPLNDNATEAERALNRRVELLIYYQN